MNIAPHPYLFAQTGLDSGALTMLGTVVRQITEPGEYRGTTAAVGRAASVFYLTVGKEPGINQVNIDLAALSAPAAAPSGCHCGTAQGGGNHFVLGAHGHAVFHVSGGVGGYAVRLGRASATPQAKEFDSTSLMGGDLFAATILRPGNYTVRNSAQAKAKPALLAVRYPRPGKTAYVPPRPVRIDCTEEGFSEPRIEITAMQGCLFVCKAASRITIELIEPFGPPT